jgi:hypothetical protein
VILFLSSSSGNGSFTQSTPSFRVGHDPRALVVANLDFDGRADIMSLNNDANEGLTALLSSNPAPTLTPTWTGTPTITGTPTETLTAAPTSTFTQVPPGTPVPTNTCPPNGICVQGSGCVTIVDDDRGKVWWMLAGLIAIAVLRWRRRWEGR